MIPLIKSRFDRLAFPLGLLGIAAAALYNWRLWQQDKSFLAERAEPEPLPPFDKWPDLPKVSVLVAAWNEAENIEKHIQSFLDLSYPHKELILCAGGSDGTLEAAREYFGPEINVLEQQQGEGKQRALNKCLSASTSQIIYLTDADCYLSDDAFNQVVLPIIENRAGVVTGCSIPLDRQFDEPFVLVQWWNDENWRARLPEKVEGILGRNCAIKRDILDSIGGFAMPVSTGTDLHMSLRLVQASIDITCASHSVMASEYPSTPRAYLGMWRRWNKNILLHGLNFGAWAHVIRIGTAFTLYGTILLLPLLSPLVGRAAWLSSGLLFFSAMLNRLRRIAIGARFSDARLTMDIFRFIPLITILDMFAVCGAFLDSVFPNRREKW